MSAEKLSGLQIGIPGRTRNGGEVTLYISNETNGKVHLMINGEEIFFEKNLMPMAWSQLYPIDGCKHGGTF